MCVHRVHACLQHFFITNSPKGTQRLAKLMHQWDAKEQREWQIDHKAPAAQGQSEEKEREEKKRTTVEPAAPASATSGKDLVALGLSPLQRLLSLRSLHPTLLLWLRLRPPKRRTMPSVRVTSEAHQLPTRSLGLLMRPAFHSRTRPSTTPLQDTAVQPTRPVTMPSDRRSELLRVNAYVVQISQRAADQAFDLELAIAMSLSDAESKGIIPVPDPRLANAPLSAEEEKMAAEIAASMQPASAAPQEAKAETKAKPEVPKVTAAANTLSDIEKELAAAIRASIPSYQPTATTKPAKDETKSEADQDDGTDPSALPPLPSKPLRVVESASQVRTRRDVCRN